MRESQSPSYAFRQTVDIAATVGGFAVPYPLLETLWGIEGDSQMMTQLGLLAFTFWLAVKFQASHYRSRGLFGLFQQISFGFGWCLLLAAIYLYLFRTRSVPWPVIVIGVVLATILRLAFSWLVDKTSVVTRPAPDIVLVGFDDSTLRLMPLLPGRIVGCITNLPDCLPSNVPYLGPPERLADVVGASRPGRLVFSGAEWKKIPYRLLCEMRYSGVFLDHVTTLYERLLSRVLWQKISPMEFVLQPSAHSTSFAMAVQSLYNNLVGLALLFATLPVTLMVIILSVLFSGPGPVLESIECTGYQQIPFRLLRFRTRRRDTGETTRIGRLLERWRLAHLPQLINLVRGELALLGPRPVRKVFGDRLMEILPFYCRRFDVRPGMLSWRPNKAITGSAPFSEAVELEWDLFYVKAVSPWLDLETLASFLFDADSR